MTTIFPRVLKDRGIASERTLRLVAWGRPTAIDSSSPHPPFKISLKLSWHMCLPEVSVLTPKGDDFLDMVFLHLGDLCL